MGYYTSHDLEVIEGSRELIQQLRDTCEDAEYAIDSNGVSEETCKWYSHQEDLKKFSLLHPEALFKLSGEGEDSGDIWEEYYRNGKVQVCQAQIVFADFDERLLS